MIILTIVGAFIENNPGFVLLLASILVGVGIWLGSMQTNINTLKDSVTDINKDIKDILDRLSKITSETLKNASPPRLNELGKEVSKELKASKWAKETVPDIFSQIEGKPDYEIQKFSFDYVRKNLKEDLQIKVEICAYERGLVKSDVLDVLAVELRDELLRLKSETSFATP